MATYTFDPADGADSASPEQQAAETQALEQGEMLINAQQEDRAKRMETVDSEQEDMSLIGGKFKSQEDLLKAYEALQSKMGSDAPEEDSEPSEEPVEASEEVTEEQEFVAPEALTRASKAYDENGVIDEATIEELAKMDSRELIEAYVNFYSQNQQQAAAQAVSADQQAAVKAIAGGEEGYTQMIGWAASNLDASEIDAFNSVANSGNVAALRFAVEALNNRYKSAEGFEAPLVSGKAAPSSVKGYRSNAELSRDIADPRYANDPAFRADVEAKLAVSQNLL